MLNQDAILQVCKAVEDVLSVCMVLAVFSAATFLGLSVVGWRGPYRKRRLKRFAIAFFTIPLIVGAHWLNIFTGLKAIARQHESQRIERYNASSLVQVGDIAPDFTVVDTQGNRFALSENRGKVILVNFFATSCGSCIAELPHLQSLWEKYKPDENFKLLVIGREETGESLQAFQNEKGYKLPFAADPDRVIYAQFARQNIPRNYLIAADGTVCFTSAGFYEDQLAELAQTVETELQQVQ